MQRRRRAVTAVDYDFYKRRFPELQEQFPVVFNKLYPLPLFVGVHKALEENTNFTPKEISALLNIWVQRHEYSCMACSIGRRYDLDGKDAGEIDPLEMTGFIKAVVRLHPNAIRKFCKRYLKTVGRPALIFIPIKDRPELEMEDGSDNNGASSRV